MAKKKKKKTSKQAEGLNGVCQIIYRISQFSGKKEKVEVAKEIKQDDVALQVVYHALNPYWNYGVLPASCDDITDIEHARQLDKDLKEQWPDLRVLLNNMISREVSGNAAREALKAHNSIAPIVQRILSKDLRCGAHIATFNEAFQSRWLSTFDVALADDGFVVIGGQIDKSVPIEYPIWAEPKYDGIRVVAVCENGQVQLFSRAGKEFTNFPKILNAIAGHQPFEGLMLDGEVFGASFDDATTVAHNKGGKDDSALTYCVWDCMRTQEFAASDCDRTLVDRQKMLSGAICGCDPRVQQAPGCLVNSEEQMLATFKALREQGYEGLVLKPLDGVYSFKRSKTWVKVKEAATTEGVIKKILPGTGKHKSVMGAVMVSIEGMKDTKVGSGFSDEQRAEFWEKKDQMVGRAIEFKHMGITPHQSYRHPVFLRLRPDKE